MEHREKVRINATPDPLRFLWLQTQHFVTELSSSCELLKLATKQSNLIEYFVVTMTDIQLPTVWVDFLT